jgi:hypothetical protein
VRDGRRLCPCHAAAFDRLVDRASGRTTYEEKIATPHTATIGDAFLGFERLRLANEGAMRANISRLIERLIALKLPPP